MVTSKIILILLLSGFVGAFQIPQPVGKRSVSGSYAASTIRPRQFVLLMSDEEMPKEDEKKQVTVSKDGTFYDDEVDPIPVQKEGISDSMKQRLIREASTGLDSDQKQTNVILYIMAAVAVLVLLGGQGILF